MTELPPTKPKSSLSPRERARFDSLYEAVAGVIEAEQEDHQLVINVLMQVTGGYMGHYIKPEHLEDLSKLFAKNILDHARRYQARGQTEGT